MDPDVELTEQLLMEFACPICKGPLQHGSTGYFCTRDQRGYGMTLGIPDFRLLAGPVVGIRDGTCLDRTSCR